MIILLMGVSGSGKTTIGTLLAKSLGWEFHDADDLHSKSNRDKMHRGIPLNDADRAPWLASVRALIERCIQSGVGAVVACSALKQSYREEIVVDPEQVKVVLLEGSRELIASRLQKRHGHFMPPSLLDSQFATLEVPADALAVHVGGTPRQIARAIRTRLGI